MPGAERGIDEGGMGAVGFVQGSNRRGLYAKRVAQLVGSKGGRVCIKNEEASSGKRRRFRKWQ